MPNSRDDSQVSRYNDRVVIKIEHSGFGYEPVNLLTYRRSTLWHELLIAGPTKNCAGAQGNNFPGMYYYHPSQMTQWVVMVDGPVDWRESRLGVSPQNGVLEMGLFATGAIDPKVSLKVWHSSGITDVPTQWQALETLVAKSFELLPLPKRPDSMPDWTELASRCLNGLNNEDMQHPLAKQLGGIAYHSMLDKYRAMYTRPKAYIELICQASIARALHRAAQHVPIKVSTAITQKLVEHVIPAFFNPELGVFENTYSGKAAPSDSKVGSSQGRKKVVLDTWYALSNLSDILYLCGAFPTGELSVLATQAVATWLAIGKELGHIFPLFLDVASRESQGGKLNVAAGGLYANVMLSAASLLPHRADELKAEAAQALMVMRRFPVQQMFHQPELLAQAAESAYLLSTPLHKYSHVSHWTHAAF